MEAAAGLTVLVASTLLGLCLAVALLVVAPARDIVFRLLGLPVPDSRATPAAPGRAAAPKKSATRHPCPDVSPDVVQELIEARRSIMPKDYTGALIDDAVIARLLDAARWAPTHGKTEPWRFVVFAPSARQELLDATLAFYKAKDASFWKEAWGGEFPTADDFEAYLAKQGASKWMLCSHFIAICMRRQRPGEHKRTFPEHEELASVACAVHNMHTLATSLHVGAYWSSWFEHFTCSPEGVAFLGLDHAAGDRWLGCFVVGAAHRDKIECYRAARKPVDQIATWRRG